MISKNIQSFYLLEVFIFRSDLIKKKTYLFITYVGWKTWQSIINSDQMFLSQPPIIQDSRCVSVINKSIKSRINPSNISKVAE